MYIKELSSHHDSIVNRRPAPEGATVTLPTTSVSRPMTRLSLSRGKVSESASLDESVEVGGSAHGTFRSTKSRVLLDTCSAILNRGGVAALVPSGASDAYFHSIAEQVEGFAATRSDSSAVPPGGILALPTSGSTGLPKLVALPAAGIAQFVGWGGDRFGFGPDTVSLSLSPWNFDVSLLDTWAVLASGGTVVAADEARLYDAVYLAGILTRHEPTFIQVVPSTLDALVTAGSGSAAFPSVRDVVLTGGAVARSRRAAAAQMFPAASFHNVYGSTEVNDCLIETFDAQQFSTMETLPLGSPIPGCSVYVDASGVLHQMDNTSGRADGELLVRTPWQAVGYIREGRLSPLPATSENLFPTKDRVSLRCGQLMYVGRRDRTIKIRGQRVNLEDVEHSALRTALVGMSCAWLETSTSGESLHLAYTAPGEADAAVTGLELRVAMSAHLPAYAMPNHLHAFSGPFPVNGNGKPDLHSIKSQLESARS